MSTIEGAAGPGRRGARPRRAAPRLPLPGGRGAQGALGALAIAALAIALPAASAEASTMPRVDFREDVTYVAVGAVDLNCDRAIGGGWSLGATASLGAFANMAFGPPLSYGLRATRRLGGQAGQFAWGLTFAAGVTPEGTYLAPQLIVPGQPPLVFNHVPWFQPALVASLPLGPVVLRGTLGPRFTGQDRQSFLRSFNVARLGDPTSYLPSMELPFPNLLFPGLEVALPLGERHEITVLGNGLLGWRGAF